MRRDNGSCMVVHIEANIARLLQQKYCLAHVSVIFTLGTDIQRAPDYTHAFVVILSYSYSINNSEWIICP